MNCKGAGSPSLRVCTCWGTTQQLHCKTNKSPVVNPLFVIQVLFFILFYHPFSMR
ncbi:hypothetical protein Peur_039064 [Populus x canadensis]